MAYASFSTVGSANNRKNIYRIVCKFMDRVLHYETELTVVCVYTYPSGLNEGKMYQS